MKYEINIPNEEKLNNIYNIYKDNFPNTNECVPKKIKSFGLAIVTTHWRSICQLTKEIENSKNDSDIEFLKSLIIKHAEICIGELKL